VAAVGFLPVLLLRLGGSLMNGWMWRPSEAETIYRQAPRVRPILARFGPVSLPDASRSIVDLLPYACGPLTSSSPRFGPSSLSRKLQHLLSRSLEFHGFMLRSLDPLESCS
jgi:hypothetical protein